MRIIKWILAITVCLTFAGCIEQKKEYTINPDGSGKVLVEAAYSPMGISLGDDESDPQAEMKNSVKKTLEKSEGVDVWSDVSYDLNDDGKILFKGTAYFSDLNKLKIQYGSMTGDTNLVMSKDDAGHMTIELAKDDQDKKPKAEENTPDLTEEQIAEKIKQRRFEYNKSKAMMTMFLAEYKDDYILHLPGSIDQSSNFTKLNGNTVQAIVDGSKIMPAIDKLVADDQWMKEQVLAGDDPSERMMEDQYLNEAVFGQKAPVKVTVNKNAKPLFDYKAEVATAKQNYNKIIKDLAVEGTIATDITTTEVKSTGQVTVIRVDATRYTDQDRGIYGQKGYKIEMLMELPDIAEDVDKSNLQTAITDTGQSLISDDHFSRNLHARLTKDKKAIKFEAKLNLPGDDVKGIKEISGTLEYFTAGTTKLIDLGITEYAKDVKSDKLGAKIKSVEECSWKEGSYELKLGLKQSIKSIKAVKFYDHTGAELEVDRSGSSSWDNGCALTFDKDGKFPEKGKIVVEVFETRPKKVVNFKLENITLLGLPMK